MRHIRADRPVRPYTRLPSVRPVFFSVIPRARSARGNPSPFHINGGQRPPPTFAAARQRRDLIIANPPEGVSKEGGPQPSLFGRSRMGDFQGGRKIETSFPLEWRSLDTFFRQGKKVSRRRHPAPGRGTPLPFGKESNPPEATKKKEKERESRPQAALLPSIYITPPSRSVHSRRCCGDRPRRRCSSRCCGTRRTSAPADSSAKWPRRCSWV